MIRFLIRRSLLVLPALFGLLLLTFVLMRIVPSDPAAALAGENSTAEQIAQIRTKYGFDRPMHEQFWVYLKQVARGDLGFSVFSNRPVAEDIARTLPATIELSFVALGLATLIGIPLGTLAAVNYNAPIDHLIRLLTVGGLAIASFWLAIMLQLLFAMDLDVLPLRGRLSNDVDAPPLITGLLLLDSLLALRFDAFRDALAHLVLPASTLAFPALATIARFTRAGVLETMQKEFVSYETAVGYARHRLVAIYVLRNSVVTAVTQIGLLFGALISSAVVVEAIFDWPGLGSYAVSAILSLDYNAILAVTLVVGIVYAIVNILVDLAHGVIDPRIAEQM
ncbi:MAG: ABC transporter permease [Lautropia sp.]